MFGDTPKHPCRGCPDYGDYSVEPCKSCPLPEQYILAINNGSFQEMAFLRNSTPDNWGAKKAKEKREMADEKIIPYKKFCVQCEETKRADQCFDRNRKSKDGYRTICSKCISDNRAAKKAEKVAADALSVKPDEQVEIIETPEESPDTYSLEIVEAEKPESRTITINFEDYPEIYDELIEVAREEIRDLENLALWFFSKLYSRGLRIVARDVLKDE